jgi:hypothetical protein
LAKWCVAPRAGAERAGFEPTRESTRAAASDDRVERRSASRTATKRGVDTIASIAHSRSVESTVLDEQSPAESPSRDPDEALRTAAKAAIDSGNVKRAMALLAMLEDEPKAVVVPIRAARNH